MRLLAAAEADRGANNVKRWPASVTRAAGVEAPVGKRKEGVPRG
jgi:hypothetical protein